MNKLIWAGLVVIIVIVGTIVVIMQPDSPDTNQSDQTQSQDDTSSTKLQGAQTDTGLKITDTVVGTGAEATAGKTVTVHYKGTLQDGTEFDSSYSRNEPFSFKLGTGEVIAGWDQGVAGMKVGGKRTLVIPPALGYGSSGTGSAVPPNATLNFDVELLNVAD